MVRCKSTSPLVIGFQFVEAGVLCGFCILAARRFLILFAANCIGAVQTFNMVRLKDIAQQAGVSVMTVSKALRDESDISAVTKARIKALAGQMGYMPDSVAQGLRNKTTKLLGLAISSITNPVFARMI